VALPLEEEAMTEAEWLACDDARTMLTFLEGKLPVRKIYLTASAFLRRFWHLIPDERSCGAVEALERYADGLASWEALQRARGGAKRAFAELAEEEQKKGILQGAFYRGRLAVAWHAAGWDVEIAAHCPVPERRVVRGSPWVGMMALGAAPEHYATDEYNYSSESPVLMQFRRVPPKTMFDIPTSVREADSAAIAREYAAQAELLRDLFNPFHPVVIDAAWLRAADGAVVQIAHGIYEERAFDRMPILADALVDAGCIDEYILGHLRGPGPHVRGCWLVDALTGKEATS
jgi:hypothetical protein